MKRKLTLTVALLCVTMMILASNTMVFGQEVPKTAQEFYERGIGYLDSGNIAKSVEDFNEALRLAPNFAEAYLDRGYAYYRLREYDRGIADCTKVISLEPDNKVAYTYRGLMWARKVTSRRDMDTINKAIADFEKAIQIDPDFAPAIKEYARFRATWVDIPR